MNSNTEKPSKVCKTSAVHEDEKDRLSSFSESILCHILSFVPTKCAARTSILSKRWKYLFLDVPKLVFHGKKRSNHGTLINFVNRRLMLCKTHTITEFRLALPKLPELSVINLWIISLLFRNLKVLEIEESGESATPQCPPSEIFGWETLVVLKLRGHKMVLKFPKSVIFPNLNVLDLNNLEMQSESEHMRFDHKGFPLLEVFRLDSVGFNCSKDSKAFLGLEIFLCTLKSFEIIVDQPKLARIDIDTPQLRQLKYNVWEVDDVTQVQIIFRKSEHLISADLYSEFNPRDLHIELLSKINGVKYLNLSEFDVQDLTYSLPHFTNLTHLELIHTGAESMLSVLGSAPKLEVLVHEMLEEYECFVSPTDVPLCLAQKLKQVRIISNFLSCTSDVDFLRFFLQHGAVLERVTLENSKWSLSTLEKLLKLPRRSPKCEIELKKKKETEIEPTIC